MIKKIIQDILGYIKCKSNGVKLLGNCYIGMGTKIVNNGEIIVYDGVKIRPSTDIFTINKDAKIVLNKNAYIGNHSRLSSHNQIVIGGGVLVGPHVFIADHNHEYADISKPIISQGVRAKEGDRVEICEGSWIGTNAVIVGNVRIGRNCVIGANSVVTHDIPDYCVAAGIPARIIKRYNMNTQKWERELKY